jgi:hypothetical protein
MPFSMTPIRANHLLDTMGTNVLSAAYTTDAVIQVVVDRNGFTVPQTRAKFDKLGYAAQHQALMAAHTVAQSAAGSIDLASDELPREFRPTTLKVLENLQHAQQELAYAVRAKNPDIIFSRAMAAQQAAFDATLAAYDLRKQIYTALHS